MNATLNMEITTLAEQTSAAAELLSRTLEDIPHGDHINTLIVIASSLRETAEQLQRIADSIQS